MSVSKNLEMSQNHYIDMKFQGLWSWAHEFTLSRLWHVAEAAGTSGSTEEWWGGCSPLRQEVSRVSDPKQASLEFLSIRCLQRLVVEQ